MQPNQVKERFPSIAQTINNAAQLCQTSGDVPADVRACISALDRESDEVQQLLADEENDNRILQLVDKLEKLGDRALQACQQAGGIDGQVQSAVQQAHDAISSLKHRLH